MGCGSDDPVVDRRGGDLPSDAGSGGKASGGSGNEGASAGAGDAVPYCDVLPIVQAKCQRCHGDPLTNSAPIAFLSYQDFQSQYYTTDETWREVAIRAVGRDIMPYTALNDPPTSLMPPVEALTADEKKTLIAWLEQGAEPEGGAECP